MGYYINKTSKGLLPAKGKAKALIADGAKPVNIIGFRDNLICVVDNGPFEAVGYAYSKDEYDVFNDASDSRPKTWLEYDKAKEYSGFLD